MDLNFKYVDENGNQIDGEILYETKVDGKAYAICNLHYGPDNNAICAFKVIDEGGKHIYSKLDETDNIEALQMQIDKILRGED